MKRLRVAPALILFFALIFPLASPLRAGGSDKKKDQLSLRVHSETSQEDGDKFAVPVTLLDGRRTAVSIMPLLSEHDIKSVYPFTASDGSYGVYLKLDGHGANLLTEYSIEHMGRNKELVVMFNGRQVVDLVVDKPVRDGIFCIPRGMTIIEDARLANDFPIIGHENDKDQQKKKPQFMPTNIMLPPKASDLQGAQAPTP